ncbi:MAG: 30S ribosomal protein S1, partial [Desulfobulbaceae bacterium]|nr:30S ribosomal protein S1 [Desulfobulbaceae bacterium]
VGDKLKAMVISVSSEERKIALSLKALEGDEGKAREEYEQKQQTSSGPSTFGDLLKAAADDKNGEEPSK